MNKIRVMKYEINENCRRIHGDEEAIDIALSGLREKFLLSCNYPNRDKKTGDKLPGLLNEKAVFEVELTVERPL